MSCGDDNEQYGADPTARNGESGVARDGVMYGTVLQMDARPNGMEEEGDRDEGARGSGNCDVAGGGTNGGRACELERRRCWMVARKVNWRKLTDGVRAADIPRA